MTAAIRIHPSDNVVVLLEQVDAGQDVVFTCGETIRSLEPVNAGHKLAVREIRCGEPVYKYGFPIGLANQDIHMGEWVHVHNLSTALREQNTYSCRKSDNILSFEKMGFFNGYLRSNGSVGIRNEIWILPMVGCVNHTAKLIAEKCKRLAGSTDGVFALEQPFGCSQLGQDHENTVTILRNIATHPNAAGVLLVALGCENNTMDSFLAGLGDYDHKRIRYVIAQDHADEIAEGVRIVRQLARNAKADTRSRQPMSKLCIGLKCGASDGFSGITANPLTGRTCEKLVANGAAAVMTEVPEMFGAETLLMSRARTVDQQDAIVRMIQGFKQYFLDHNQQIHENPSPGNKDGGISTLEEKSIGCIQKGGNAQIEDVLAYGQKVEAQGLSLLAGPGNDPVSITALASCGCQAIVFTTGRGNPLGSLVPTIKVASNTRLAAWKQAWIDFDAGPLLDGADMEDLSSRLYALILEVADGQKTKSEQSGYKEIGIFKSGVTL